MAVEIRIVFFWIITSCTLVGGYQRFGAAYRLHLQVRTLVMTYKATWRHNPEYHNSYFRYLLLKMIHELLNRSDITRLTRTILPSDMTFQYSIMKNSTQILPPSIYYNRSTGVCFAYPQFPSCFLCMNPISNSLYFRRLLRDTWYVERMPSKQISTFVSFNRWNYVHVIVVQMGSVTSVVLIVVSYQWKSRTHRHNPEDYNPNFHCRENVTSQKEATYHYTVSFGQCCTNVIQGHRCAKIHLVHCCTNMVRCHCCAPMCSKNCLLVDSHCYATVCAKNGTTVLILGVLHAL
jgi:hypothetical protein